MFKTYLIKKIITVLIILFFGQTVQAGKITNFLIQKGKEKLEELKNTSGEPNESNGKDVKYVNNGNKKIKKFSKAKKKLWKLYKGHEVTIYCGCKYKKKKPDFTSCGYIPKKNNKRANRIEWEHVVPAHAFGKSFKEWTKGDEKCVKKGKRYKGRRCAGTNKLFAFMEADMYNLYPAIGEVNGLRSNYTISELPGEPRNFGKCDVEISKRKFEPPDNVRGDIARTYMYMDAAYPKRGVISKKNKKLIKAWDKMDPVDEWECKRAEKIKKVQGNTNMILKERCN